MGLLNLVRMTVSGSPGTGSATLLAAVAGYLTVAQAKGINGQPYTYAFREGNKREVGRGVWNSGTGVFTRDIVLSSTNSNALENFTSAAIFSLVAAAEDFSDDLFIRGLTLSCNATDYKFDVAAGVCRSDDGTDNIKLIAALTGKDIRSDWAVGAGNGALDTYYIAAFTWYHVFLIKRPDTGAVDALISLSPTAPTMPANYTLKRRIGSILTTGLSLGVITPFTQCGDEFLWKSLKEDWWEVNSTIGTAAVLYALSVPLGIQTTAIVYGRTGDLLAAGSSGYTGSLWTSPDQANDAATLLHAHQIVDVTFAAFERFEIRTDTSSQIRVRMSSSTAGYDIRAINTVGWIDRRGRDG